MAGNPKRVTRAFLPDPIRAGALILQPFTAGTVLFLEKIDHPLVDDGAKRDMTNEEVMTLLFVLTRPVREANGALNQGPEAFEEAVLDFASTIPLSELPAISAALRKAFSEAVSTVTPTGAGPEKKAPAG